MYLSQPSMQLLREVDRLKQALQWDDYSHHVMIQFRAFVDCAPSRKRQMSLLDSFLTQAAAVVQSKYQRVASEKVLILLDIRR